MLEEQQNNPLHGVKTETLLTELVAHYGWEILACDTNLNCFKNRPDIKSSLKFLAKNKWAREKVESFYLYKFKNLPKADDTQFALPPRERAVPLNQKPRTPKELTIESIEAAQERKAERAKSNPRRSHHSGAEHRINDRAKQRPSRTDTDKSSQSTTDSNEDAWAKWR